MSLRVEAVKRSSNDLNKIKRLYLNSFPVDEQTSFWFLVWKSKKEFVDLLAFYDKDVLIGFTYMISDKDLTFVFYLAIEESQRSKGYGSSILVKIQDCYPRNRLILNIEAVDGTTSNNKQRMQRKKFYLNNGYKNSNFMLKDGSNAYEVLTNGGDVTVQEYSKLIKKFAGTILSLFVKPEVRIIEA